MSKSFTGDHALAEMTEGQPANAAFERDNLTDDASDLQPAPPDEISATETVALPTVVNHQRAEVESSKKRRVTSRGPRRRKKVKRAPAHPVKQRFGLPDNFVPRLQRYGRSVLLELNIYRLPNGAEYLPTHPVGTLGSRQHLYALLTVEQYLSQKRGSVYVRNDGRIFDYSVDNGNPGGDIFDTGYTIYELERTGRYAPQLTLRNKKREAAKVRAAGIDE